MTEEELRHEEHDLIQSLLEKYGIGWVDFGREEVTLDGTFNVEELERIVAFLKKKRYFYAKRKWG